MVTRNVATVPPPVWAHYINASNWTIPGADVGVFAAPLRPETIFDLNVVPFVSQDEVELPQDVNMS